MLSPSTAKRDRATKRRLYQQNRVGVIWLVDTVRGQVEEWTNDARFPVIETERVTWHAAGATEPLVIDVAELLSDS